jgi:streptogramin lyase
VFSNYTFEKSQDTSALAPKVIGQWKTNNPSFIAFGFGSVWVTDHYNHNITRIDPVSNQVIAVIQGTGTGPEQALEVGDVLWVTGQHNDTTLIDPKTNTVIKTVKGSLLYMAYGFDSVWITTRENTLNQFDPTTAEIIASIKIEEGSCDCMNNVFVTASAVWVDECDKAELIKIDPLTKSVVSKTPYAKLIDEAKAQTEIPAGKGTEFIWVAVLGGLLRIDPNTGAGLTFLPLSPEQAGDGFIAVTDETVWLAGSREINRVNIATNQIDANFMADPGRLKVGVAYGSVWLRNFDQSLIQRLDVAP